MQIAAEQDTAAAPRTRCIDMRAEEIQTAAFRNHAAADRTAGDIILPRRKQRTARTALQMNAATMAAIAVRTGEGRFTIDIGTTELRGYTTARTTRPIGANASLMADIGAGERDLSAARTARIHRAAMIDHSATDRDRPARATHRIAHIDTATIDHFAVGCRARRGDHNLTILCTDALRLQRTIIGNQVIDNRLPRGSGKRDFSAIRRDHAMVRYQLRGDRIRHRHLHQPVAIEIHRRRIAGGQMHFAQLRGNGAIIDYARCNKPHQPCIARGDATVVGNRGIAGTLLVERQRAIVHECIVMNISGAHHQSIHIGMRTGAENHAVLIDDNHITVGCKVTIDMAGTAAIHAVQRNTRAIGLHELRRLARANIKPAPVDHGFVADLIHRQRIARRRDARLPCAYHSVLRICARRQWQQTKQCRCRKAGTRG